MEDARRASLIDEKARQLRAIKVGYWESSSRVVEAENRTIDGVEDTTEGVPTTEGATFGNRTRQLVDRRRFGP